MPYFNNVYGMVQNGQLSSDTGRLLIAETSAPTQPHLPAVTGTTTTMTAFMSKMMAKNRLAYFAFLGLVFVGDSGMSQTAAPLQAAQSIIAKLNVDNIRTRSSLEKTFDLHLEQDGGTSAFSFWQAQNIDLFGLKAVEVSYREPLPGAGATAGSILLIHVDEAHCVAQTEVLAAYPFLKIDGPPAPTDPDPNQYYSDETNDASLSFGFPLRKGACLREIVFSLKRP